MTKNTIRTHIYIHTRFQQDKRDKKTKCSLQQNIRNKTCSKERAWNISDGKVPDSWLSAVQITEGHMMKEKKERKHGERGNDCTCSGGEEGMHEGRNKMQLIKKNNVLKSNVSKLPNSESSVGIGPVTLLPAIFVF